MFRKTLWMGLVMVWSAGAWADEAAVGCRLKGGSVVPLPAATCAMEGGTLVNAAPPAAPAVKPVVLSQDPKLAAVQRAIIESLNKPVLEKKSGRREPESIEREAKFEECTLLVDERMQVDHGNMFSSRMDFKVHSSLDFRKLGQSAYRVVGKVNSLGGGLKAHAVSFEESRRNGAGALAVSVQEMREDGSSRSYRLPGPNAYWETPQDDLWMADEYGYPTADNIGNLSTVTVRVLYLLGSAEEADALKQSLDELSAVCKPAAH